MKTSSATLAAALFSAVLLAGCSGGAEFDGTVEVSDNEFEPGSVTISAGEAIHFELADGASRPHTVTIHKAGDPTTTLLLDEDIGAGGVHFAFVGAGTYHVWCTHHGTMMGGMSMVVTVE